MNTNEIAKLIQKYYNISGTYTSLGGYDDINNLIQTDNGQKYVSKIIIDPEQQELVFAQDKVVAILTRSANGHLFPAHIKSIDGHTVVEHTLSDGKKIYIRLIHFLSGKRFDRSEHTKELFYDIGVQLATMDKTLLGLRIPEVEARNYYWDLKNAQDNEHLIKYIGDHERRRTVKYFFLQFETFVLPTLRTLRRSIIHGDANDQNLLVQNGRLSGIFDFGDMVFSNIINELAVCIAYAIPDKDNPIQWATPMVQGFNSIMPLEEKELEVLYYLIATRLCISACRSAYSRTYEPENEYRVNSENHIWKLLSILTSISPVYAENEFRKVCGYEPKPTVSRIDFIESRHRHISKSLSISYSKNPIRMVKSALQYMYDDEGNTYLDCVNNIPHIGHCHPETVKAASKQMAELNTNTRYLYDLLNDYSDKLCKYFPKELQKIYYTNSGSASTDLALRLARNHTGRKAVIVVGSAYHGNVTTAIEVSPYKYEHVGGPGRSSHIFKINSPDLYRGPYKHSDPDAVEKYALEVKGAIQQAKSEGFEIAAFLCESMQGCAGQLPLPSGYLKKAYAYAREVGAVCIADEVQTGFGRSGSHFWAYEMQGVTPDIVILGKPIANGHPMAAVVANDEIVKSFENGLEYFNSFGGNPVSLAIAMATLYVIEDESLQQNALNLGSYLMNAFKQMQAHYNFIGEVRGSGFFLGVELINNLETFEPATEMANQIAFNLRSRGILLSTDGPFDNVLKFKPPMVFNKLNADFFLDECEKQFRMIGSI